mmetsp:Transcript_127432/g.396671  ORF Transcript_127432/g.396671 Transcript_127432/m.396671 type:complete len:341 (-) Transcript_127432:83-1105(-)
MMMLRGNDENIRPEAGPNDQDRERFGFTKRKSRVPRQSSCGLVTGLALEERINTPGPLSARGDGPVPLSARAEGPVALVPLVDSTLGDPDAKLHLLRARPAAPKYDFKGRINELTDQNRALRSALAEERERRRQLADVLGRTEADINFRLRASAGEIEDARRQLDTQGKLEKMVQEAVRSVWREEAGPCPSPSPSRGLDLEEDSSSSRLAVAELQVQLQTLRQCSATETSRALRAELLLREREEELARAGQELRELREQLGQQREATCAREGAALDRARAASELVRDAGGLLQQQEAEYAEKFQALSAMAEQREEELVTQLEQATAKAKELERRLASAGA